MNLIRILCATLLMVGVGYRFPPAVVHAAPPAEKPPKTLDEQLLKDLAADLLEGLPQAARDKSQANDGKPAQKQSATAPDEAAANAAVDPLERIGQRMRQVQQRLEQDDLSLDTRGLQKEIVDDLAALIEQTKKQQAAGGKKPGKPGNGPAQASNAGGDPTPGAATESTNRVEQGKTSAAETAEVRDGLRRYWGHLPQKLRDELQNSFGEQFLPKYERLIEDYYKRLAEERPGSP